MKNTRLAMLPVLGIALMSPLFVHCSAEDLKDLAEGCDEMNVAISGDATAIASLDVDAKVKVALQATADLKAMADLMVADVGKACVAIATDLGATDTWTAKGDAKSTEYVKYACNAATAKIDAIMQAGASAGCTFSLAIQGGACEADFSAQAKCDAQCSASGTCDPGTIEARCDPGELSGTCSAECSGSCSATVEQPKIACEGTCNASCEGSCSGACEGTIKGGCDGVCEGTCDGEASNGQAAGSCKGECKGSCTQPAASATCEGSCKASCKGTCTGSCEVSGGAKVKCDGSCKGGCSVEYTAPKCEGTFKPPSCEVDANCSASCQGSVTAKAKCTPPTVNFVAQCAVSSGDIDKLVATLKTNLPALYQVGVVRGQAAVKAAADAATAITGTFKAAGSLGGKAVACIAVAAQTHVQASASISVSVEASASASGSASGGTK